MRWLARWAVGIAAVLITVQIMRLLPAQYELVWDSVWRVVIFVPVLAMTNAVVGSVLRLVSLPITCLTFGLFGFVINAAVFWIAGAATGAHAATGPPIGFASALLGSIIYTVISTPLSAAVRGS